MTDQRVAVVTGGGGGIGAAVAEALGAAGCFVVTADPLVTVDGSAQLPSTEETTAGRIVAAGGTARASAVSVTDADGVRELLEGLVAEFGRLDAVVNVAGITRPTGFAKGIESDWRDVLSVHLDGYLNVLAAALPIMAAAGRGHILGVTSGSGWRAADAGAYSCAKRAVAALTWQLGRAAPAGVVVNAMSPIAATRMVTAALARAPKAAAGGSSTGGLSLGSMPTADQLGPMGAHLVGGDFGACHGEVVFVAGSEAAVVAPPALLEAIDVDGAASLPALLRAVVPGALAAAEARQATSGGSNPRFTEAFSDADPLEVAPTARRVAIVAASEDDAVELAAGLATRDAAVHIVPMPAVTTFASAAAALAEVAADHGALDGVVVALAPLLATAGEDVPWKGLLHQHTGIVEQILTDAAWTRATADLAAASERPVRIVTLTGSGGVGGSSRAQAAAQLSRSARSATAERVDAFAVSVESGDGIDSVVTALVAHLLIEDDAGAVAGAELVVGDGFVGLRSHPRATGSVVYGGPAVPRWFDDVLAEVTR